MDNCFHFTYKYLKDAGFNIPDKWNGLDYLTECDKIADNPKYYLKNGLHEEYFNSFTTEAKEARKYDIILHKLGVGVALDSKYFITKNHIGKIIPFPIRKPCKIRRVI